MNFFNDELRKQLEKLKQMNNFVNPNMFQNGNFNSNQGFKPFNFDFPQINPESIVPKTSQYQFDGGIFEQNSPIKSTGGIAPSNNSIITDNWGTPQRRKKEFPTGFGANFENPKLDAFETKTQNSITNKPAELPTLNTMNNNKKEKAENFKNMYIEINENINNEDKLKEINKNGWRYLEQAPVNKSHYKAVTMINDETGELAVFNMGTNKWNPKDIGADAKMVFNKTPEQFKKAKEYHDNLTKDEKYKQYKEYKINSIGHSEGGSESQYVGLYNPNIDVYTYNAYGIGKNKEAKNPAHDLSNIYNVRNSNDPVSKHGENIGYTDVIPSDKKKKPLFFGYFDEHKLKNMGDINNAVPIEEYKKQNPDFVSSINDILFTSEDVGKMDTDTFQFYEPYIDELLKKQILMPSYELNKRIANGFNVRYNNGYYQFL